MNKKYFPILHISTDKDNIKGIPYKVVKPHEKQVLINHGQTLERLTERGGLSLGELFLVLCDLTLDRLDKKYTSSDYMNGVFRIIGKYYCELK